MTHPCSNREWGYTFECLILKNIWKRTPIPNFAVGRVRSLFSNRLPTIVYNTQNYWVSGLCPSSGIPETRKHNVSETGAHSVLRWGETPILFGLLERVNLSHCLAHSKGPNRAAVFPPHLRIEIDQVSEIPCFLVSRKSKD
jgi:hypothetical protein